jgi:hypothetical protein
VLLIKLSINCLSTQQPIQRGMTLHQRIGAAELALDCTDELAVADNEADQLRREVAMLRRELSMVQRRLPATQPNHSMDAGEGLIYADHREQYKEDMAHVIHQGQEHHAHITLLTSEIAVILERLERLEDTIRNTIM